MMVGVYVAIGVAVVLAVVILFMGTGAGDAKRKALYEKMQECMELAKGDVSARKDAVVRLDAVLGESLAFAGVKGETVGERLKNAGSLFDKKTYDAIWSAHKLRNTIVHEHHSPSEKETKNAVSTLSSAIRRLLK
jgi:hypothetical protein